MLAFEINTRGMKNRCRLILTKYNRYIVLILLISVLQLKRSLHLFALITQLKTTDTPYKTKICRESIINKIIVNYILLYMYKQVGGTPDV